MSLTSKEKSRQIEKAKAVRNALDELCGCFRSNCIGCPFSQIGGLCKLNLTPEVSTIIDKIINQ